MNAWALKLASGLAAVALCGDGVVIDGPRSDLPISSQGGMTHLAPTQEPALGFTDAGLLWKPEPVELTLAQLDAGAPPPDAGPGPEVGITGPCAPIAEKIAHRRAYLIALEQQANQVGWAKAAQVYCGLHPGDPECQRPPTAVEQDISALTRRGAGSAPPETDAWIVRWIRDLHSCDMGARKLRPPR